MLDGNALRLALLMNSNLAVIGEINESCLSKEHTLQWGLEWKSLTQALNCDFETTLLEVWIACLSVGVTVLSVKTPEEMTFLREY